ncbi:hypothetical protein ACJIZ3_012711 [Penstemon smallii]|uniref:BHLH domain-containing protein n=1 Tax=Penstemon smallii TaxID=265156 RepID=A0ABD3UMV0_9LAMI
MGEYEFGGGVCGGNWHWNSSINLFSSSPCSSTINGDTAANNMPSSIDWINQELFHDNGRLEENYFQLLQQQARLDYCSNSSTNFCEDSNSINNNNSSSIFKQVNDHHQAAGLSTMNSDNSYSLYTSSLLQTLFDTDSESLLADNQDQVINYSSNDNFLPSNNLPKASPAMSTKQHDDQLITNNIVHEPPMRFISPLTKSQLILPSSINNNNNNTNRPTNLTRKLVLHDNEEASDSVASEPAIIKRPRIETPSPLPTFKVRKEKLGDRITALQQLVSPFGKTDTASVLQEAIEYIKFLHDQATALSSPYFKNGPPPLMKSQQASDKIKEQKGLKSRGLCLVPISSTFPVASETSSDFWTPTFGGTFH